jgi:SWIM zinc finger
MSLTLAKVEEIAPDQGSLSAARKLLNPRSWPVIAGSEAGLVWGECQGSGSQPYRVVISESDLGYKCTCPSRKFPCKHSLALMWMRAEGRPISTQPPPDWVNDWLARRRGPSARPSALNKAEAKPKASISTALEPESPVVDPKAQARALAQRERNRAEREAAILAGMEELDLWILDQLERGLAGFQTVAREQCGLAARRLVDAKASGLASRVEQLPAALFGLPETLRADFLIEKLGELHLIAEAYRRQAELPEAMKADLRLMIGWTMSREDLLGESQAMRLRDRWMVLAATQEIQPDKLRRLETWLARLGDADGPRFAVLMDFVPVSIGAVGKTYSAGETFEAELAFYPSSAPLRAIIAQQFGSVTREGHWQAPPDDVSGALDRYEASLGARPWLGEWPIAIHNGVVARAADGLVMFDSKATLPIRTKEDDALLPLIGIEGIDAFGLWDGRRFDLKFAETPLGRWLPA